MGVKDLWDVLEKVRKDTSMEQMNGQTLAIDLSVWLHQGMRASRLKDKQAIKPHVRNLFARACLLLRHHVRPVFVFDGPPPKLKQAKLEERRKIQMLQAKTEEGEPCAAPVNRRFATQQCSDLLNCLGLPHITSTGEAEMTCAQLNQLGIVDGCITEDSDVFLFGAKTVYRNFNVCAGKTNTIHRYEMAQIEESTLNLTREKLIVFALLAGCDYGGGVRDVGKEKAVKLLHSWPSDGDVLQRLQDWRTPDNELDRVACYKNLKRPVHCRKCDHLGTISSHSLDGCYLCHTCDCYDKKSSSWRPCLCQWHKRNKEYATKSLEINIRKKACTDPEFPNKEIIEAFLHPEPGFTDDSLKISWTRPSYDNIKAFLHEHLYWEDDRINKKVLPILTSWDLSMTIKQRNNGQEIDLKSEPLKILKTRIKEGKRLYEVKWKYIEGINEETVPASELLTEELAIYMKEAFPELVAEFETELNLSKPKKRKSKSDAPAMKQVKMSGFFKEQKKRHVTLVKLKAQATTVSEEINVSPENEEMEQSSLDGTVNEPKSSLIGPQL